MEFCVVFSTSSGRPSFMKRRRRICSSEHFSEYTKIYWVFHDSLNDTDKDMKEVMVSFFDDLITYKEVEKTGSMEDQQWVFGKLSCVLHYLCKHIVIFNLHSLLSFFLYNYKKNPNLLRFKVILIVSDSHRVRPKKKRVRINVVSPDKDRVKGKK